MQKRDETYNTVMYVRHMLYQKVCVVSTCNGTDIRVSGCYKLFGQSRQQLLSVDRLSSIQSRYRAGVNILSVLSKC